MMGAKRCSRSNGPPAPFTWLYCGVASYEGAVIAICFIFVSPQEDRSAKQKSRCSRTQMTFPLSPAQVNAPISIKHRERAAAVTLLSGRRLQVRVNSTFN